MAENIDVHIKPDGLTIQARSGEKLSTALIRAGIPISFYCQGRGICGKCFVRIVSGILPFVDTEEQALLEKRDLSKDCRLACLYEIRAPLVIELLPGSKIGEISSLETEAGGAIVLNPAVKIFTVDLPVPSLAYPQAQAESLENAVKSPGLRIPVAVIKKFPDLTKQSSPAVTVVTYRDNEVLEIEAARPEEGVYGLAVDIGTSTVAVELVCLETGKIADRAIAPNTQIAYGADVVSRIAFAYQNPENLVRLRKSILQLLDNLIEEMTSRSGIPQGRIYEMVVSGNTAMNHILCGVSLDTLALSPFNAVYSRLNPFPPSELGLDLHPMAKIHIVPNIKSFIGGDITAGLTAVDFGEGAGNRLFVDLGTNGEIVLKKGKKYVATSTAAGPAFEGMSISCGMLAVPGAVHKAEWKDGFILQTIGDLPPQGICGTGLNDILALALVQGMLESDGKILSQDKKIPLTKSLSLSQQDVREMQLGVAAIKSGIKMLLNEYGVPLKKLDRLYIAGAFGSSLDISNAKILGLVPDVPEDIVTFIGNSSLGGARKLLLSDPHRAAAESLAGRIGHVSLATKPGFQEEFVRALEFGT